MIHPAPQAMRPVRLVALALALLVLGWVWHAMGAGFDFTDEGYYLQWMAHPWDYHATTTQFGYVYHPLYWLIDGDLSALRRANLLITLLVAWGLSHAILRHQSLTAFLLAVASLAFYALWLPTPNYNSLAFQAALLVATGLVLTGHARLRRQLWGWALLSIGGWLAFLAKPTVAAALGVLVVMALLLTRRWHWRGAGMAVLLGILLALASSWAIAGSPAAFIDHLRRGLADGALIMGDMETANIWRLDTSHLGTIGRLALGGMAVSVVASIVLPPRVVIPALIVACMLGALPVLGFFTIPLSPNAYLGMLMLGSVVAVAGLLAWRRELPARESWVLAVFLLLVPHAYAFGTGNNYWSAASAAAFFWIVSAVVLMPRYALHMAVPAMLGTVLLLNIAMAHPYRQPLPLPAQQTSFNGLRLSPEVAAYLTSWQAKGFPAGEPVIDLSGQSPGLVHLMGAVAPGYAWTLGGYPGSEALLRIKLATLDCETLARSWVLDEPDGTRRLSPDTLREAGIDLRRYEKLGPVTAPANGELEARTQYLYRPRTSTTCEAK